MQEKMIKHKNWALFLLLLVALLGTYLFEEKRNVAASNIKAKKTAILNVEEWGELQSIQGVKLHFEKRGELFYDQENGLKFSPNKVGEFFQILSGLKVKEFLNQEEVRKVGEKFYIPDPTLKMKFKFKSGEINFILGKKLDYDQSFYMQIHRDGIWQTVIANDESPDPGVYQSDEEHRRSDVKYNRLQMMFLLTNKYFYDTRVFSDFNYSQDKINFKEMTIATFRNKKFALSFLSSSTIPPAPKGINYFEDNWVAFHRSLSKLEGKNIYYPADFNLLGDKLSQLDVIDREGKKYTLELYKKYGAEGGYFLKSSLANIIYQLKAEDAQYFFVNIQDFWEKKVTTTEKEFLLKLTFFNNKDVKVKIVDGELFRALPTGAGFSEAMLRALEFKKLIDFLKAQGDHVSEITEEANEMLKKSVMKIQLGNKAFLIALEENEAIIVDLDLKVKIHHYVGAKIPFSIRYEDYFMTVKK